MEQKRQKPKGDVNKMNRYKKAHERCEICGHYATTVHHILPVSLGGENEDYNFIALCEECHGKAHKYGISKSYLIKYAQSKRKRDTQIDHIGLLKYIDLECEDYYAQASDIIKMINEYADMTDDQRKRIKTKYDVREMMAKEKENET